ncbi:MAG TPA: hypothetical protein DCG54_09620 [Anaerolineae bacterium]|jgi:hypothetical protein|nr:hypothetical protein [Anaerolineae bacterium]
MTKFLGVDAGNGAFKIYGSEGGLETLSQVAWNGNQRVVATMGLKKSKAPLNIKNGHGSFYIGAGAHDYGRPVENLDVERFNGTPEMVALFHGAMTQYQQRYGMFGDPLSLVVGLPQETLTGETADSTRENVRRWLLGAHNWSADGAEYRAEVADVKIASQVSGGLFDYLLDDDGKFIPSRKGAFTKEVGIISVGFGTVELLVVRDRAPVQRFTAGATSGVRRLLEIMNGQRLYSLGEMDIMLRGGHLETSEALPIWEREVMGVIERQWGTAWRRFAAVLVMGGGAILLPGLALKFNGRGYTPDNPVQAIARGLYKMTLLKRG